MSSSLKNIEGLKRVFITRVNPSIDNGKYQVKRILNDIIIIDADIFTDGIDEIYAELVYKHESEDKWKRVKFSSPDNDCVTAKFLAKKLGIYHFTIEAWIDEFSTWKKRFVKKMQLKMDVANERAIGVNFFKNFIKKDDKTAQIIVDKIENEKSYSKIEKFFSKNNIKKWLREHITPAFITRYEKVLSIRVDPAKAGFSAWYEVFPRSVSSSGQHGSFQDLINYLPHIKELGFDVIYLPPIHPIGKTNRKGKNNSVTAMEHEPGSPWAIGSTEGGHKAIHPELGSYTDLRELINKARTLGIDIALDFALQCSPDHPYLHEHPEWFKHLPDGSLQYAENPPKKYQDIYPLNFGSEQWQAMWLEFKSIIDYWIKAGITLFRVDNPHTKPFIFWEWLIQEIKKEHPEVLFLSEAFTRPKVMYHLAKCGFSQSYTYFTWRNTKEELTSYMEELVSQPVSDFFRPNFWANTPDILPECLQTGGQPAFIARFILAATLSSNYGLYGPVYENCINTPLHEGAEEYLDSEKYEIKRHMKSSQNIDAIISRVNHIRKDHPALQNTQSIRFHTTDNPQLICYSKHCEESRDHMLIVVNLDYQYKQSGFIDIKRNNLPLPGDDFVVHDLLHDETYQWHTGSCYVELDPAKARCAHIFHIRENPT
ncbi:hypothetical protein B1207_06070 [Legionella quinlivanii]|uniref:Alpha-1,4-glucan:maltose-1-phosphate maltosyltransferase n=1 Tax=Legionella quinlivanii TaxID=45073 RepID=A0A364LK66_9GAMM|nr:alpha-1,4-glucan--maltose-1-phosphate maltosyltransferase [Legionella quinlivanii]RAP36996.1 hypothetical protein B1207_06070 [Legionella quinlivanii]